jgi:hypothetical protein
MNENNRKTLKYVLGAALGLGAGLVTAHLYARAEEENHPEGSASKVRTMDIFKVALTAIGLMRQITEVGARKQ